MGENVFCKEYVEEVRGGSLPLTNCCSSLGLTLVRAMIAVARADGRLDAQESQTIFQKIQSLGLDSESNEKLCGLCVQWLNRSNPKFSKPDPERHKESFSRHSCLSVPRRPFLSP
jgi:hypothetical protein